MTPSLSSQIKVIRVTTTKERLNAVEVLGSTYAKEKRWIGNADTFFAPEDLESQNVSWFLSLLGETPVGVLRILYDPPMELYRTYGMKALDSGLDVEGFIANNRIAEIGRFAVVPAYRSNMAVVASLMRAASCETIERDYSHYVTDVFEGEKHSPYDFHTRVMGFKPVATHDVGELNCPNRRITMVLDLVEAYHRLKVSRPSVFRFLTRAWPKELHERLSATSPSQPEP
ncbi:MAG: GNAT family N-acetyltransferase [Verrucomicrobiota bacterium]